MHMVIHRKIKLASANTRVTVHGTCVSDLKQDNYSTVRGDGEGRVGEVRAGTTFPMPEHKGFKLQ